VPYGAGAVLTEYWDLFTAPDGRVMASRFTSAVEDPQYLQMPWLTALHFQKEAGRSEVGSLAVLLRHGGTGEAAK